MRDQVHGREDRELLQLRADHAALAFQFALLRAYLRQKANFDPNHPRVPRGFRNGGRWTDGPSGPPARARPRGAPPKSPQPPDDTGQGRNLPAQGSGGNRTPAPNAPLRRLPTFDVELPAGRDPALPSHILETAPKVSEHRPVIPQERFRLVREIAYWAGKTAIRAGVDPRRIALHVLAEGAQWLVQEYWPYIKEYLEPAKSLQQLQDDVRPPRPGTEVHHIVEQGDALRSGHDRGLVHRPDNLVRISTLRHWEVTAWYQIPQDRFGGLTPRAYLREKSWDIKYQIGLEALRDLGILAP